MVQVFGKFIDKANSEEHLTLGFSPSSLSIEERWRNNGISADYIADYLSTLFPHVDSASEKEDKVAEIKSSVSYITNELLENAMKYCDRSADYPITVQVQLESNEIRLFLDNSIVPSTAEKFQGFIQELLNSDPEELYISQLEKNAEEENEGTSSGLGFISMVTDYSAQLGWKFETLKHTPILMTVTTMVRLMVKEPEAVEIIPSSQSLEMRNENHLVSYDGETREINFTGKVRLRGMEEYREMLKFLNDIVDTGIPELTINIKNLELLNSSGIDMLSKFVIGIRKSKSIQLTIIGSEKMSWQEKCLKNFKRLMPGMTLKFE
ncbi:MAG: DUF6272 family protein [Cyanobacteria bacterium P01_A01_bin.84]